MLIGSLSSSLLIVLSREQMMTEQVLLTNDVGISLSQWFTVCVCACVCVSEAPWYDVKTYFE